MDQDWKVMHKGFKIFIIIFIIGILFFLQTGNRDKIIGAFSTFKVREKVLDSIDSISMDEDIDSLYIYNNTILKWNDKKLSFLKMDGRLYWEKDFNFQEADIVFGDKTVYIMNSLSGDIYSLDLKGETKERIQLKEPIFGLKEFKNNIIVHIKTSELEKINILDSSGKSITHQDANNGNILNYVLNNDSSKYLLSTLHLKDNILKSIAITYSIDGEELNKTEVPNEIIVYTSFIKDEMVILTDKNLHFIKDNKVLWKKPFPNIKDIYINKDRIFVLYDKNFEIVEFDGRTESKFIFAEEYNKILSAGKYVIIYGEKGLSGIQDDTEIFRYKSDEEVLGVYLNKSDIVIHTPNKIEYFNLKNRKQEKN